MKKLILLSLSIIYVQLSFGQAKVTAGFRLEHTINRLFVQGIDVGTTSFDVLDEFQSGFRYAWYTDIAFPNKLSLQLEAGQMINTAVSYWIEYPMGGGGAMPTFNTVELRTNLAYRVFRYIQPYAGLSVWHIRKINPEVGALETTDSQDPRVIEHVARLNRGRAASRSIQETRKQWIMHALFGLKANYGRFLINAAYEFGLTPFGDDLDFEGQTYDLRQYTTRITVGVGINIIK